MCKINNHIKRVHYGLLIILAFSCSDIFEEDLNNKVVELNSPTNNSEIVEAKIRFWWNKLDGANSYNLQIVSPSFIQSQELLVDTIVSEANCEINLFSGNYQWRVNALNSTSQTIYSIYNLNIVPAFDLSQSQVTLISPQEGFMSSESSIEFSWEALEHATNYSLVIKKGKWISEENVYTGNSSVPNLTITLDDGNYVWGVAANDTLNNKSTSFALRELVVDHNAPTAPLLTFPINDTIVAKPEIKFMWYSVGEPATYQLSVYNNSESVDPLFYKQTSDTVYHLQIAGDGNYFWKVRAVDANQNPSSYSTLAAFSIKQKLPISDKNVEILYPTEGLTVKDKQVTFLWNEIEDATKYHLQVVSPSFEHPEKLVLDEWIEINKYSFELEGGDYQVRVLAIDGASQTDYSTVGFKRTLFSEQKTNITFPREGTTLTDKQITFLWDEVDGATKYHLQIVSPTFDNPLKLALDEWVETNKYTFELEGGNYQTRVLASDGISQTNFCTINFEIYDQDLSARQVVLTSPVNNFISNNGNILFKWEEVGDQVQYQFILKQGDWNSGILLQDKQTEAQSISYSVGEGKYSWAVKATDKINKSQTEYSIRSFNIDQTPPSTPALNTPQHKTSLTDHTVVFNWTDPVEANEGDQYLWELYKVSGNVESLVTTSKTSNNSYSYSFGNGGTFRWRVKAMDQAGNFSSYSSKWEFYLDETPNIANAVVELLAPADSLETSTKTFTFWWNEVPGAEKYVMQIVSPNFENIELLVDEMVSVTNKVSYTMPVGSFEWRVKAVNSKSETAFTKRSLVILP